MSMIDATVIKSRECKLAFYYCDYILKNKWTQEFLFTEKDLFKASINKSLFIKYSKTKHCKCINIIYSACNDTQYYSVKQKLTSNESGSQDYSRNYLETIRIHYLEPHSNANNSLKFKTALFFSSF